MKKEEFTYPSKDGKTSIHAIRWIPEESPVAILQIAHGMVEFIDRYDRFAKVCAGQGIYVVGNDHLGHGKSVTDPSQLGYFGRPDGNALVIGDMHQLRRRTQEEYPDVPYFLLGHSMGSFLARQYISAYGKGLAGAIIMGTGLQSNGALVAAKTITRGIAAIRGESYRSKLLVSMTLGPYNKSFEPARTPCDWLTRDEAIVDAYMHNELNQFMFTTNGYANLFRTIQKAQDPVRIAQIPSDLPVLIVSGGKDPVGHAGKDPQKLAEIYRKAGIRDVTCKIYPEDRHEILNELDKDVVDQDILTWIRERMPVANA